MTPCLHPNPVAHGLCAKCYQRKRRGTDPNAPERAPRGTGTQVAVRCSTIQLKAWERAARRAKQTFRDWIRAALDREADRG
jgi:hypothetical protein